MKKRLPISIFAVLALVVVSAGVSRSFSLPIRRQATPGVPPSGLIDREQINGPREVMKSKFFYEQKLLPELTRRGVFSSESSWINRMPIIYVGENSVVIIIPRGSRHDAELIRDAIAAGLAGFEFHRED